jgi:hypothetical protein
MSLVDTWTGLLIDLICLLCTLISLKKIMKQYSFKYAEPSVNNISTFCQVADQLLQQNIER